MRSLKDIELANKKVILRAGFDVPVEYGQIVDDSRIRASLETIKFIKSKEPALLVIVNHIGRPEGRREGGISNQVIVDKLKELLGDVRIRLVNDVNDLEVLVEGGDSDSESIYILENIRFWEEEESNDDEFSKAIGQHFDLYVNDAFSVSHRAHASFVGIPKYTAERCMGLLFEEEYVNLSKVKDNPEHPAVMVIGGAKIETKLPVIENMMKIYDKILVGGKIANEALDQNMDLGEKVLLPIDFSPENKASLKLDIGPKTVEIFKEEIRNAKTVVWNGPLGKFEDEDASMGTKEICEAIVANEEALQVVGGGETLEAIKKFGSFEDFDYVSMSGGAMLEYLEGKELPGIKALR